MIKLSNVQLNRLTQGNFSDRMALLLHKHYADDLPDPADPELQKFVQTQSEVARSHGFSKEREVATYILAAWILGADFDTAMPAVAECLASTTLSSEQKADWLEIYTITLLDVLSAK
ncbi:hypothetical protein [Roseovarius sp. D22-M7]|uniref:hypothetical protein n=1 Tax=Roseovarius sp. D22-M7 TaxID=3127116 RepID=UPI0030105827